MTYPEGMKRLIKMAKKATNGKEFLEAANALRDVPPKTSEWFSKKYSIGPGEAPQACVQFVNDVKAGKYT